jgi:signal peptidase II
LVLAFLVVLVDQAAKYFVLKYSSGLASINPNLAWSLHLRILEPKYISLATLGIIIVLATVFWNKINQLAALLIIAGSFSNLIDRFWRGGVLDFINLKIWPSFNLADLAITVGLVWLGAKFVWPRTLSPRQSS